MDKNQSNCVSHLRLSQISCWPKKFPIGFQTTNKTKKNVARKYTCRLTPSKWPSGQNTGDPFYLFTFFTSFEDFLLNWMNLLMVQFHCWELTFDERFVSQRSNADMLYFLVYLFKIIQYCVECILSKLTAFAKKTSACRTLSEPAVVERKLKNCQKDALLRRVNSCVSESLSVSSGEQQSAPLSGRDG